ncbi:MAG: hypothetical protein K6E26_10310 [Clostridiales bacterium]|nr:hypothetical protein [Clostridiales bacterium]
MKDSKMRKARSLKCAAGILALVMVLPLASCNRKSSKKISDRKYASGKEIQETDPFFNAEINELKIPVRSNAKVVDTYVKSCDYRGKVALATYEIFYETDFTEASALFDDKGNVIRRLTAGAGETVLNVISDDDGNILMLLLKGDGSYVINFLNEKGETVKSLDLGKEISQSAMDRPAAVKLSLLPDGRYVIYDDNALLIYDKAGIKALEIADPGRKLGATVFTVDGKTYVTSSVYDMENGDDVQIKEVNLTTGSLGKGQQIKVPQSLGKVQETKGGLYVSAASGCYMIDIHTGELTLVFDWNDTDVGRQYLVNTTIVPKNDDEFYACCSSYNNNTGESKTYLLHLTRAEKNPHAGKKILVIGGSFFAFQTSLVEFISSYNSDPSNRCRAVFADYYDETVTSENEADITRKVYLEILSGDAPDILVNFGSFSSFQTDNVMVDMNKYLDGKDGIDRSKYYDNIFRAMEKNGGLYHVPIRFDLSGLQVNTDLISQKSGWTFDEFDAAASSMPEKVSFMESMKYRDFLKVLLTTTMNEFVDYEDRKVDFQNDTMKKYLEMTSKYGVKEIPKDEGQSYDYESDGTYYGGKDLTELKFSKSLLAVRTSGIMNINDFFSKKESMSIPTAFLGFPSSDSSGMAVECLTSIGIVQTSDYKDLAWDLIRSYMEYALGNSSADMGISTNREVFDKEAAEAFRKREESYKEFDEKREELIKTYGEGGVTIEPLYNKRITQADVDEFRAIVENVSRSSAIDEAVFNVIAEEAAGYFAGDRTEEDVLKNIENRTKLIVSET